MPSGVPRARIAFILDSRGEDDLVAITTISTSQMKNKLRGKGIPSDGDVLAPPTPPYEHVVGVGSDMIDEDKKEKKKKYLRSELPKPAPAV